MKGEYQHRIQLPLLIQLVDSKPLERYKQRNCSVFAIRRNNKPLSKTLFTLHKYVDELTRMGANIKVESNIAIINGVTRYTGARVNAPDLRAGAALVIAGLVAEGITVIDDIYFIERGYEEFDQKLRGIGAQIEKVSDEKEIQKFILKVS